jgi:DNA helicase-2/ATP-dependent DNA helicase PcrA
MSDHADGLFGAQPRDDIRARDPGREQGRDEGRELARRTPASSQLGSSPAITQLSGVGGLFDDLTDAQRAAASHGSGPALVLAGPGSGKTRVITRRIAALIAQGVPPWKILALTFTNKAAGEMRERVSRLVARDDGSRTGLVVSTFHSHCAAILRRFGDRVGLQAGFSIYDGGDQKDAIKAAIEEAGLSNTQWTPASVLAEISDAKNKLRDAAAYLAEANDFWSRSVAKAYASYEAVLTRSNAVDFDDLLLKVALLLRGDAEVRELLQRRHEWVLVDEYQDTNHAQFVIAHALAERSRNLFVVGDPDQSIYGWRGADISNILEFEEHFSGARVIPLGENFRSTGHIVSAAAGLISHNRRRKHKELTTSLGEGVPVRVLKANDEHEEADRIADFLEARSREGVPWRSMAVLYRMNALSRVIEDALRRRMIPSTVARGTAFYDRKEIKDALAYLRVCANPRDEVSLRRIVNVPTRGIGDATVRKIEAHAVSHGLPLIAAFAQASSVGVVSGKSAKAVEGFVVMIRDFARSLDERVPGDLAAFVSEVLETSGLDRLEDHSTLEERERVANLEELVSAAADFRLPESDPAADAPVEATYEVDGTLDAQLPAQPTLGDAVRLWLESVSLVADADAVDPEQGSVTLMTLHAAKGLEFDSVAVIGVEHGILPHSRASEGEDAVEEERRLLFVGMTRAERALSVSSAAVRTVRGVRQASIESEFLREIPSKHVSRTDLVERFSGSRIEYDDADAFGGDEGGEGMDAAELFPVGSMVRHPIFGVGKVEYLARGFGGTRARIAFRSVGLKTLIVEHAKLSRA